MGNGGKKKLLNRLAASIRNHLNFWIQIRFPIGMQTTVLLKSPCFPS